MRKSPGGTLTINSTNPFDSPLIDPGFFTAPIDMLFAREGFRRIREFLSARAWDGFVLGELPITANATTDELDAFVKQNALGAFHPVSTLAMSAREAKYGVVDPDLKVKNVKGLRVVDASVMVSQHIPISEPWLSDWWFQAVCYCWTHPNTGLCDCGAGSRFDYTRMVEMMCLHCEVLRNYFEMNHHCFNGFIYFRGFDRGPRPGHMDSVLQKPLETQGNKQETETIIKGSNWAGFTRETRG